MKTDTTSYVLQTLKKIGPFDEWKNTPYCGKYQFRSDASLFKEYAVTHPQGRVVARETSLENVRICGDRIMLVAIAEQMDKVRLVAQEVVS